MIKPETKQKFQDLASLIDKAVVKEKEKHADKKVKLPNTSKDRFEIEL